MLAVLLCAAATTRGSIDSVDDDDSTRATANASAGAGGISTADRQRKVFVQTLELAITLSNRVLWSDLRRNGTDANLRDSVGGALRRMLVTGVNAHEKSLEGMRIDSVDTTSIRFLQDGEKDSGCCHLID